MAANMWGPSPGAQVSDQALRGFAGYNIKRAFSALQADLARVLAPHGLRMTTFSALAVIAETPGLRQSQLADVLAIERPNLVVIIDELAQRGLITRDKKETDRRACALCATALGRRISTRAVNDVRAHEARILSPLDPPARARLFAALEMIESRAKDPGA